MTYSCGWGFLTILIVTSVFNAWSFIIQKDLSFRSYCHDSNVFRFLALQRFNVNRVGFRWTHLTTIFLVFQCFGVTQFHSDKPVLLFWVSEINSDNAKFIVQSNRDLSGHATRVWLQTSRSKWLCFQSETQAVAKPSECRQGVQPYSQPNRRARRGRR